MSKEQTKDLFKFLKPFPDEVKEIALWLREFVWDLYPNCNELIYDNYNALAFGWSPTDKVGHTFCSIAVGRSSLNVHFGFYWGSQITDSKKILLGEGNQYRYILVKTKDDFPKYVYKEPEERSLLTTGTGERQKANYIWGNDYKIYFIGERGFKACSSKEGKQD